MPLSDDLTQCPCATPSCNIFTTWLPQDGQNKMAPHDGRMHSGGGAWWLLLIVKPGDPAALHSVEEANPSVSTA